MAELLGNAKLYRNPSKEPMVNPKEELKGLLIGLYFSAGWCQPCRQFTPQLRQFYDGINNQPAKRDSRTTFEIVFLSQDKNEAEMAEYLKEHGHWLFLAYGDILNRELKVKFGVRGLPSLVILRQNGKMISLDGAEEVQNCFSILDEKKANSLMGNWQSGQSPDA